MQVLLFEIVLLSSCHRGEQTYAMGWLKIGPMEDGRFRGGGHTDKHAQKETQGLPRFGALVRR
jgi:hypothetical protein